MLGRCQPSLLADRGSPPFEPVPSSSRPTPISSQATSKLALCQNPLATYSTHAHAHAPHVRPANHTPTCPRAHPGRSPTHPSGRPPTSFSTAATLRSAMQKSLSRSSVRYCSTARRRRWGGGRVGGRAGLALCHVEGADPAAPPGSAVRRGVAQCGAGRRRAAQHGAGCAAQWVEPGGTALHLKRGRRHGILQIHV